jgi:hypothetical protein
MIVQPVGAYRRNRRVGIIGISTDVHAVENKILIYALEQAGCKVVNLGVMVSC